MGGERFQSDEARDQPVIGVGRVPPAVGCCGRHGLTAGQLTILITAPLFAWLAVSIPRRPDVPAPTQPGCRSALVRSQIDPNSAPWWELTALPGIGATKAKRIVDYRRSHQGEQPAFRQPADLDPVPGIGPKTIQQIAPRLAFPDSRHTMRPAA